MRLERAELELERLEREREAQARNDLEVEIAQARKLGRQRTIREIKNVVIGPSWRAGGSIPADVRARALDTIEARLSALPVNELPLPELIAIAEKVRDEVYQPVLAAQDRRRAEEEARRRQEEQERLDAARRQREEAARQAAERQTREAQERQAAAARVAATEAQTREAQVREAQERQRCELVQRGVEYVEEDLDLHEDLDLDTREEIVECLREQFEQRLTGTEDAAAVDKLADELLAEEFGESEADEDEEAE